MMCTCIYTFCVHTRLSSPFDVSGCNLVSNRHVWQFGLLSAYTDGFYCAGRHTRIHFDTGNDSAVSTCLYSILGCPMCLGAILPFR